MPTDEIPAPPAAAPVPPPKNAHQGKWQGSSVARKILLFSVLAHLLFGVGAAVWIVQRVRDKPRQGFVSAKPAPNVSNHAFEHKVQMKRKAMSAPVAARRATTTGLSPVTLPPTPALSTQLASISPGALASGMGGPGLAATLGGGGGASGGFGKPGGTMFMASIGGLNVQARQLGVMLDISGSVAQYQDQLQKYVAKNFPKSEVDTFSFAAFTKYPGRAGSIGTVMLDFLNSPKAFDSIYVFSDFGEINKEQDALSEIQGLIRVKKVRLYLHVLREAGKERKISPGLQSVIAFARSTGGNVKIGTMPQM